MKPTSPKLERLKVKLSGTRCENWFSWSKNRLAKKARRSIKRATRREQKRIGLEEIKTTE